jgi:hypothetical protein
MQHCQSRSALCNAARQAFVTHMATNNPRRAAPHSSAFAALPSELRLCITTNEFIPMRVESSGALCLGLSNLQPISQKRTRLAALKLAAAQFGLEIARVGLGQSLDRKIDDGFLLAAQEVQGQRPRLFDVDGSPNSQAIASGCSVDRQRRHQRP